MRLKRIVLICLCVFLFILPVFAESNPITFSRPADNIRTSLSRFYLNGASDPQNPLYLNGELVENRSEQGYFGVLVPLEYGENRFILTQGAYSDKRVIYRNPRVPAPKEMSTVEIPVSSTFPQAQEYRTKGENLVLSCLAPVGSSVTVKLNGTSHTMEPSTIVSPGPGIYPARYTYTYTIPGFTGDPRIIDLGRPVYKMQYRGAISSTAAPARIGVIMKGVPYYAQITENIVDTYKAPVTGNGAANELYKGMIVPVTGMSGNYARLSTGDWIFKNRAKIELAKEPVKAEINRIEYSVGERWDKFNVELSHPAAAVASFDGKYLTFTVEGVSSLFPPKMPENALISHILIDCTQDRTEYLLPVRPGQRLDGYYTEKTSSGLVLYMKRHPVSIGGNRPLQGLTIMIDAGHGGNEPGAIGPLALDYAEKKMNVKMALKLQKELERLGAKVLQTRTSDIAVSLYARLNASRNNKPDLFISIHSNSMPDNVDISKVDGFAVFYREALAKDLSEALYRHTVKTLNRNEHGVHVRNFYVTRGTWTPSILLECGFVPNPVEFEWLTDEYEQTRLVKTLAEAITKYFSE